MQIPKLTTAQKQEMSKVDNCLIDAAETLIDLMETAALEQGAYTVLYAIASHVEAARRQFSQLPPMSEE